MRCYVSLSFQSIISQLFTQLNDLSILFQTIQFSISHLLHSAWISNTSIWSIDRAFSSATATGLCGLGSDGNEGILRIAQSSSITGTSPSDFFNVISRTHFVGWMYLTLTRCKYINIWSDAKLHQIFMRKNIKSIFLLFIISFPISGWHSDHVPCPLSLWLNAPFCWGGMWAFPNQFYCSQSLRFSRKKRIKIFLLC